MIAWATASVTTSASVTLRLAFLARSGRRSSAVANTAVRSKSRSASIVAPWVDGENYVTDRLRLLLTQRLPTTHQPWNQSSRRGRGRQARRGRTAGIEERARSAAALTRPATRLHINTHMVFM